MTAPEPPREGGEQEHFEPGTPDCLPAELALARLPVGRHGLPRSFVVDNQRRRLIAAMLAVLPRHGYAATTIGHLTREARVSRAAFYEQFAGKEECFLTTYDLASEWFCEKVERGAAAERWPTCVRAGASEALHLLASNPALARLAIEASGAGPAARERQRARLARLAAALRAGRPARLKLSPDFEQLLLGGAVSLIARYVEADRAEQLPEATAQLVQYLLIPYLGPQETERIAAQAD